MKFSAKIQKICGFNILWFYFLLYTFSLNYDQGNRIKIIFILLVEMKQNEVGTQTMQTTQTNAEKLATLIHCKKELR